MIKKEDTIKNLPFFSKGCLVFKESGHTLVKDRGYYRCAERIKNKCHRKEETALNAKNLEDKFSGLLEKFYLPEGKAIKLFDNLIELYIRSMRKSGQRDLHLETILNATGNLMIADLKDRKNVQKTDLLEFKRVYFELLKNSFADLLQGFFMDFLFALTKANNEQDDMNSFLKKFLKLQPRKLAHTMSLQVKHIYLSNDGHIENIEFEPFGWFILQYFKNQVREYTFNVPDGFILNTKKFISFEYEPLLKELLANDLKDTYSYNVFATDYAKEKMIKSIFDGFEALTAQEKIDYLIKLNAPTQEMMFAQIRTMVRG